MSREVETRERTFTAGGAIGANLRVKLVTGKLVVCDALDTGIGVTRNATFAVDEKVAVALWNMQGTVPMVCAGAVLKYALIYGAANGQIDDAANVNIVGYSMEAGSGANSIIEVMPLLGFGTLALSGGALLAKEGDEPMGVDIGEEDEGRGDKDKDKGKKEAKEEPAHHSKR